MAKNGNENDEKSMGPMRSNHLSIAQDKPGMPKKVVQHDRNVR
jgi:hypothetical protein